MIVLTEIMECFFDITAETEKKCKPVLEICTNNNHYEIIESSCELKLCSNRTANLITKYPCGDDECYYDTNTGHTCVSENCTYSNLYGPNENGIYELRDCTDRNTTEGETIFPCGFGNNCVYDIDDSCGAKCSNEYHYESINGRCVLKTCSN
jgi:hypothetical protein